MVRTTRGRHKTRGIMVHFSDEALIEEVQAGSRSAYGRLMERYERLVFKVGVSYTRNEDDALDISQNVFMKAYQKLDLFKGKGSFKGWLLRIAHNESISWLRKQRHFQDYDELTSDETPRLDADQESRVIARERWHLLQNEIIKLNARQQMAVILRYFEGMPIKEIAGVLECSDGVVKSILFRSLEKMRSRLHEQRRRES